MFEESDHELIRRYLAGDNSGFEILYERHRRRLYGYLNTLMPWAPAEVDDLFQQTWIKAVKSLSMYKDQGYFAAWLFRIGKNLLIDRQRRQQRNGPTVSLDADDQPLELGAPPGTEPWRELDESELSRLIADALKELTAEQREVFLLRKEGKSFREIAEIQQCPLNTALARMQYALKNLRTRLGSIDQGGLLQ